MARPTVGVEVGREEEIVEYDDEEEHGEDDPELTSRLEPSTA